MAEKQKSAKRHPSNRRRGQPSKYTPEIQEKIAELIRERSEFTDRDLASMFGVTFQTINNWKHKYPQYFESLKSGKLLADASVETSLYQRARGYSHPDVHVAVHKGQVTLTPIIKHYPPDPTSIIFWLKNRKKDAWRDKIQHELGGMDGKQIPFQITTISEQAAKETEALIQDLSKDS